MIKHVLLDAMGVLFTVGDDTNELLIPFVQAKNPAAEREEIRTHYHRACLGEISSRAFWEAVGLGGEFPYIETEYLYTQLHINREIYTVLPRLSAKYHLSILSNDVAEWSEVLQQKYLLKAFFSPNVISGSVGLRKPDPAIYRYALTQLQADAGECVFVDDREQNLLPARELGMHVFRFGEQTDADQVPCVSTFSQLCDALDRL